MRMNRFFILSEGGHAVTMDELNEFLNLWNKSCVATSSFESSCERSKHILSLRDCAFDAFGRRKSIQRNRALGQQESEVEKLINFFELVDIFPNDNDIKRKMTEDFFWDRVRCQK